MKKKSLGEFTESEFAEYIRIRFFGDAKITEEESVRNIIEFNNICEHPERSDLIFYPKDERSGTPAGIVCEIKKWLEENGKPGFKAG